MKGVLPSGTEYVNTTDRPIKYIVWRTYWDRWVAGTLCKQPISEPEYLLPGETAAHCLQRVQEKYPKTFYGDIWLWVDLGQNCSAPEKIA